MKPASNLLNLWRRRRYLAVTALALAVVCMLYVASALGDAGNPILGTIRGTIVPDNPSNPSGGVTVYVRGQWNWLSHNSDCNFDRAATGVGIIWNDPNSPGYTVSNGSITAGVGVQSSMDGNVQDRMVHPVDLGNQVEGYTAGTWTSTAQGYTTNTAGDYPQAQAFVDPSPPSPSSFASWKGGCGREPLTATASKDTNAEATGLSCASGTTTCSGHPWGSWGYEKNSGLGYSHHYARRADVTSVCSNFYDVHGGGKFNSGKFQLVNGAKEITVNENGDNSIKTNKFNTGQGGNCVFFPGIDHTTAVTNVAIGSNITDTAFITGAASNQITYVQFHLFAPSDASCVGTDLYSGGRKSVTGSTSVTSDPVQATQAGAYHWTAELFDAKEGGNELAATGCGETGETSKVKAQPTIVTGQKVVISDFAKVTSVLGTPTGTVDFQLFQEPSSGCTVNKIYDSGPVPLDANGLASTNNAPNGQPPTLSANGTYSWLVSYTPASSSVFTTSSSPCGTEQTSISGNTPGVDP
jgi:hypothetical protein